jgi:hypothetical protein
VVTKVFLPPQATLFREPTRVELVSIVDKTMDFHQAFGSAVVEGVEPSTDLRSERSALPVELHHNKTGMNLSVTTCTKYNTLLNLAKKPIQLPCIMHNMCNIEILEIRITMVKIETNKTTFSTDKARGHALYLIDSVSKKSTLLINSLPYPCSSI